MSAQKDMKLSIKLDGKRILSQNFENSVIHFLKVINEVSDEVVGEKPPMKWLISVKAGCAELIAEPVQTLDNQEDSLQIIQAITGGVQVVETSEERPDYFTDTALTSLQEIAKQVTFDEDDIGINNIYISNNGNKLPITHHTIANVKIMLKQEREQAYSSVTGKLRLITDRKGLKCSVDDEVTGKAVECKINPKYLDDITGAFRKRVSVWGLVTYDKKKFPKKIDMEHFREIKSDDQLPNMYDVRGILGVN